MRITALSEIFQCCHNPLSRLGTNTSGAFRAPRICTCLGPQSPWEPVRKVAGWGRQKCKAQEALAYLRALSGSQDVLLCVLVPMPTGSLYWEHWWEGTVDSRYSQFFIYEFIYLLEFLCDPQIHTQAFHSHSQTCVQACKFESPNAQVPTWGWTKWWFVQLSCYKHVSFSWSL